MVKTLTNAGDKRYANINPCRVWTGYEIRIGVYHYADDDRRESSGGDDRQAGHGPQLAQGRLSVMDFIRAGDSPASGAGRFGGVDVALPGHLDRVTPYCRLYLPRQALGRHSHDGLFASYLRDIHQGYPGKVFRFAADH
jgi:hypothetical protein